MLHVLLVLFKGDNEHDFKEKFVRMDNEQKRQKEIYSVYEYFKFYTEKRGQYQPGLFCTHQLYYHERAER